MFLNKNITVNVPSLIPPVVLNALITSGNKINFVDNIEWIGNSYVLHEFENYKIIDSAQRVDRNQYADEASDLDLMFFSFYPTKPVGSCDGGIIVSNDLEKIEYLRTFSFNGMSFAENNWERIINMPGYKFYMNSIQAYIANENLSRLDSKKSKLARIRDHYNALGYDNTSDHLYRIRVENRNSFITKMKAAGIICGIHYESMHQNLIYNKDIDIRCINSEIESSVTISIPFHEELSINDVDYIIANVKNY